MGDEKLTGPCTDDVNVAHFVGGLLVLVHGCFVLLLVVVVLLGVTCFTWGDFVYFIGAPPS